MKTNQQRNTRYRRKIEYTFRDRLKRVLELDGWLCQKTTKYETFDLAVFKSGYGIAIEVKGRDTDWPKEQRERQKRISGGCGFVFIRQSRKKNRRGYLMKVSNHDYPFTGVYKMLLQSLNEYLEATS